jgi:hypothetical protein
MKARALGRHWGDSNLPGKLNAQRGGHHNPPRTRQAVRGIKQMFREDGLL